jgi:hypothetical protein
MMTNDQKNRKAELNPESKMLFSCFFILKFLSNLNQIQLFLNF